MDSFELNKILGTVLATMLLITAVRLMAGVIYQPPSSAGLVGPDVAEQTVSAKTDAIIPLPQLLKQASVERGQRVAKKCLSCHSFNKGEANRIGPNLWNTVNRSVASVKGFGYSAALKKHGGQWNYESLNAFLHKPRKYVSGTLMSFAGLRKPEDRAAILLYLRSLSDKPAKLP